MYTWLMWLCSTHFCNSISWNICRFIDIESPRLTLTPRKTLFRVCCIHLINVACFFFFCVFCFLFCFFFFGFRIKGKQGIVRTALIMILKNVLLDRSSNGSLLFRHRPIHKIKRTVFMRGSRLTRSDRTVQSGFKNHDWD